MRVQVWNGDQSEYYGEGNIVDHVTVYYVLNPEGNLTSFKNAEEEPHPSRVPVGGKVIKSKNNPKIKLDDGRIVYGCQTWWKEVQETVVVQKEQEADPWAENAHLN